MLTEYILYAVLCVFSALADGVPSKEPHEDYIPCERGWFLFKDKCYKIGGKKRSGTVNFGTASERCKEEGGMLATVYSKEINDFLATFLILDAKRSAWIGLHDQENESVFTWQDGTPYDFNYWEPTEPSGKGINDKKEDCTEMVFRSKPMGKAGQWNDLSCDSHHRAYICQAPKSKKTRKSPDPRFCPGTGGAWKYQDSCYNLVTDKMSWQEAENHCQEKFQGHLIMISDWTVDFFLDYILSTFNKEIWIGIKVKEQRQQKWSSGWFVAYNDWSKDQGDFVDGTCVLRFKSRLWTTTGCSEKYSFICETTDTTNITEIETEAECNSGVPMETVIGMGSCILLQAILLVVVIYCLRPCGRGQAHTSYDSPSIPASERPRFSRLSYVRGESEYYEDMTKI